MSSIILLNPNLSTRKDDVASSGIPYWPTTLAYASAFLKQRLIPHHILDAFGENPTHVFEWGEYYIQGLTISETLSRVEKLHPELLVSYAGMVHNHDWHINLVSKLRSKFPKLKIIILENTQQVTSYTLKLVADDFIKAGANLIYTGEAEINLDLVIKKCLKTKITETLLVEHSQNDIIRNLDNLPFPNWANFPIENYWQLGYAHGPKSNPRYLPIYTSRGCPFGCAFCTIPKLNGRLWRGRSAKNIVKEMDQWAKKYAVTEFHFEDVNPAMVSQRMQDLSEKLISLKRHYIWKIVSGTKVEAIIPSVISKMALAGCRYISISPESGSPRVLKLMHKPFSHSLALEQIKLMSKNGIATQACFVLGFPGETTSDRQKTVQYLHQLVKVGLDEFAPFIMTPIPGSSQWLKIKGYKSLSQLTFSPSWRKEFNMLNRFRFVLFAKFICWKFMYNPFSIIKSLTGLISGHFYTKTEMTIHRYIKVRYWLAISNAKNLIHRHSSL